MTRTVGLDHLTLLNLSPPDLVTVAADAGFTTVGLRISPVTRTEPVWPMAPGSAMLAETRRRLAADGMAVLDAEAVHLAGDPAECEPVIETAAALGARYLTVLCDEPDLPGTSGRGVHGVPAAAGPHRGRDDREAVGRGWPAA
jgi:sugar phosphate isomerase/epimerase